MSNQPPPAPTARAIGPCPTIIKLVGAGSLPRTIAPPDHPLNSKLITFKNVKHRLEFVSK